MSENFTSDGASTSIFYLWDTGKDKLRWIGDVQRLMGCAVPLPCSMRSWLAHIHADDRESSETFRADLLAHRSPAPIAYRVDASSMQFKSVQEEAVFVNRKEIMGIIRSLEELPATQFPAANSLPSVKTLLALTNEQTSQDFVRFFDLSLDLFCIANLDGYFLRVNPNFSKVLGFADAELLSQPFLDFVHPDDRAATLEQIERLKDALPIIHFRNRYRDVLDQYHVFEWTAKAVDGLVYAVARDFSDRIELEDEILSRKQRERAILDNTPAMIYVKGVDHRYQFVNRQYSQLLQLNPEQVIGQTDHDLRAPSVAARVLADDCEVISRRDTVTVEESVPQPDGLHTFVSVKFPLFDAHGEVSAVAGISTDISDRLRAREAEQELQLAQVFQRTLYPSEPPQVPGLEISGAAFPVSQVCGDYYDFIPFGKQFVVSLGDVSGHGYKPALQMVELRTSLRILLRKSPTLQSAMEELNDILCFDFAAMPSFVSMFLCCLDVEERSLRYIGAGHEAYLIKADGNIQMLDSSGLLLGVLPCETYPEADRLTWESGDVFAVFTDGFYEAINRHDEQMGRSRVLEALAERRHDTPRAMVDNLFTSVKNFVGDVPVQDDMTVVAVKANF